MKDAGLLIILGAVAVLLIAASQKQGLQEQPAKLPPPGEQPPPEPRVSVSGLTAAYRRV